MPTAAKTRYANGVFVSEGDIDMEYGTRVSHIYLSEGVFIAGASSADEVIRTSDALLDEAKRAFDYAFDGDGRNESRVKRGATLAWEAAWMNASESRGSAVGSATLLMTPARL